jgi:hypothetical protein
MRLTLANTFGNAFFPDTTALRGGVSGWLIQPATVAF